jgi:tRNA-specific 2-thiouridylase
MHIYAGHHLIGLFMHNWDSLNEEEEEGHCSSDENYKCVRQVCEKLDIPCKRLDFVKEYWNSVFT